jgi:hypothetical protein
VFSATRSDAVCRRPHADFVAVITYPDSAMSGLRANKVSLQESQNVEAVHLFIYAAGRTILTHFPDLTHKIYHFCFCFSPE